ncbi:MAG: ornithine cyclodeaminase [Candidatus Anammoxibacter sp.]
MVYETVILQGHIVDSLTLPKVLDQILSFGGSFSIVEIDIGRTRVDTSRAVIRVEASSEKELEKIVGKLKLQGVSLQNTDNVMLGNAPEDGVFPENFYSTTNLETFVKFKDNWLPVDRQEMDLGIRFDSKTKKFFVTTMNDAKKGDPFIVGHKGVRVTPSEDVPVSHGFRFMSSSVSTEKPTGRLIREVAQQLIASKKNGLKNLFVLGPAVVHGGGVDAVVDLVEKGWINLLFAGNALATHDIESSLFGTSLGVSVTGGDYAEHGNEHHLRAINTIRSVGGIRKAVEAGVITSGIMCSCINKDVPFVLAGSIRDDGPLPEVITDVIEAQNVMRQHLHNVGTVTVVGTLLHGIAVGNLLPASVPMFCVDANPASVTKFADRGSFQCMGIVMDGASFFNDLVRFLTP